jgi:hypothetical protein
VAPVFAEAGVVAGGRRHWSLGQYGGGGGGRTKRLGNYPNQPAEQATMRLWAGAGKAVAVD